MVASGDEGESGDDAAAAGNLDTDMDLGAGEADALAVRVNAIDAYWLQREIADAFKRSDDALDAAAAQQKERDVMRLLAGGKETAELEADLVYHLDYKRFELIKVRSLPGYPHLPGLPHTAWSHPQGAPPVVSATWQSRFCGMTAACLSVR